MDGLLVLLGIVAIMTALVCWLDRGEGVDE